MEDDGRFIIKYRELAMRVVCSCMVWKKCGAALVRWFWSEMLVVALPAHPQNGTQSFKSSIGSPCWLLPSFRGWPATNTFPSYFDGLARSRNKLEKQRTSTKNKNNNNEHKQEGITTHPNHNNYLENKEHNQEQGKHNFEIT